jgi:hypothetical protein
MGALSLVVEDINAESLLGTMKPKQEAAIQPTWLGLFRLSDNTVNRIINRVEFQSKEGQML